MTSIKMAQVLLLQRPGEKSERVHLETELKSGGAGTIYSIKEDSNRVIKLYHADTLKEDGAEYLEKIVCMLGNVPKISEITAAANSIVQLAWPLATAHTLKGEFVGFAMPTIDLQRTTELEYILSPKQAQQNGLSYNLGVVVTLAFNLASIVESIHRRGHAIVDLKPNNLKYYIDELNVAVLDCDGFYINIPGKTAAAPQVTPDYLAPEFQNAPLTKPEHQDRFALAVIIFKLLNFNIHPYTGVARKGENIPSDQEEKIKNGLYPYGVVPHKKISPVIASIHEVFPAELRVLFDRAFGGPHSLRPRAEEWVAALRKFAEKSRGLLVRCAIQHLHFKDMPCGACLRDKVIGQVTQKVQASTVASSSVISGIQSVLSPSQVMGSQSLNTSYQQSSHSVSNPQVIHSAISPVVTPQPKTQAGMSGASLFDKILLLCAGISFVSGFFLGWGFWGIALFFVIILYMIFGWIFDDDAERVVYALTGGLALTGITILLFWIKFALFPGNTADQAKVVKESVSANQVANKSKKSAEEVNVNNQLSIVDDFLKVMNNGEVDAANKKVSAAIAAFLEVKNKSKDMYSKLLMSTLDLAKLDMETNRKVDAQNVLFETSNKLLTPDVVSVMSSHSSRPIESQILSLVSVQYMSQRNFPETIVAARRSIATKLFAISKETETALNTAHFVLSIGLLMNNQHADAAKEYGYVHIDALPESERLFARMMQLIAKTRANQLAEPELEAKKQFAGNSDEEMQTVLQFIKDFASGTPDSEEIVNVAVRLVAAK